jgi:hypothetical protein
VKALGALFIFVVVLTLAQAQQKEPSLWSKKADTQFTPQTQTFPLEKNFHASPENNFDTDTLTMTTYGPPGVLIMSQGDDFNGYMINYRVCDIWRVVGITGSVNWGDNTPATPVFFDPALNTGRAGTIKTYQTTGVYSVSATISATCDSWYAHGHVNNTVSGKATATVYESIPISTLLVTCGGSTECPSMRGGQTASAVVTTTAMPSTNYGALVRISISGPGTTIPYMIEPKGQRTVSFDIPTSPVTAATDLTISVNSGGITVPQIVHLTQ